MVNKNVEPEEGEKSLESTIPQDSNMVIFESDLLPGDVLIYRPRASGIIGAKISAVTGSPYTHAAIYLGEGIVAESNFPRGVEIHAVKDSVRGNRCIAVLRSQVGFGGDRPEKLRKFADTVVERNKRYDLINVLKFQNQSQAYFNNQLGFIIENYGRVASPDQLAEQNFFCSAFVVACYVSVGLIGESAQVAYQPIHFSPGHLHKDPVFGWLLGFLVPEGGSIPEDDPILHQSTRWRDCMDIRWW